MPTRLSPCESRGRGLRSTRRGRPDMQPTGVLGVSGGTGMWTSQPDPRSRRACRGFAVLISSAAQTRPSTDHGAVDGGGRVDARRPRRHSTIFERPLAVGLWRCTPKRSAPRAAEAAAQTNIADGKCEDSAARPIVARTSAAASLAGRSIEGYRWLHDTLCTTHHALARLVHEPE